MMATLLTVCVLASPAPQPEDFLVYPGALLTRVGGERWNATSHAAVAYFLTDDAPALVAKRLAQAARDDGRVVTVDGSEAERVVSVMFTRERILKSVILVTHEKQTLGFSVLRRLDTETPVNDSSPRIEGALPLAEDLPNAPGAASSRWWMLPRGLADTRAHVAAALSGAGYSVSNVAKKKGGLQFSAARGAERADVELVAVAANSTVVAMRWLGAP